MEERLSILDAGVYAETLEAGVISKDGSCEREAYADKATDAAARWYM